jgi:general secretion pathway protein K
MSDSKQQSGSALISALFITALTAIIATALMVSQRLLIHHTTMVVNTDQMYLDLQGVQNWAEEIILKNNDLQKTSSLEKNFYGTHVRGKIYAQGGLFNINCLAETVNQPRFVRLLQTVVPNMTIQQAGNIATAVNEWLLPSRSDDYYMRQNTPYRAPHRLIVNVSELRAVRGITANIYEALKPYITALPSRRYQLDINYAPVPVLMTLSDKMTLAQAKLLQVCRKENGIFNSINNYIKLCGMNMPINRSSVTVNETYYIVWGNAERSDQQLSLTRFLMKYTDKNSHMATRVIWQELG